MPDILLWYRVNKKKNNFVTDLEAEVKKLTFFFQTLSTMFGQNFEVEIQTRFEAGVCSVFYADVL